MFCFRWPQTIVILLPHTVYSIALNFCLHFTISSLKKTKKTNRISSFVFFFFLRCWSKWSHTCIPTVPFFYDLCEQHAVVPCDDIHVTTTSAAERMILRPTDLCMLFFFMKHKIFYVFVGVATWIDDDAHKLPVGSRCDPRQHLTAVTWKPAHTQQQKMALKKKIIRLS